MRLLPFAAQRPQLTVAFPPRGLDLLAFSFRLTGRELDCFQVQINCSTGSDEQG